MTHLKLSFHISQFTTLFITFFFNYTNGEYEHPFNNGNGLCVGTNCPDQSGNGISGGMWFGPRLGRRRRSGGVIMDKDNDMENIVEAINSGSWNFAPYHGLNGKRHSTQFTPRLGRELDDEFSQRIITIDDNNNNHLTHLLAAKSSDVDFHQKLMHPPSSPLFQLRVGRQQIYTPSSKFVYRLPESLQNF